MTYVVSLGVISSLVWFLFNAIVTRSACCIIWALTKNGPVDDGLRNLINQAAVLKCKSQI